MTRKHAPTDISFEDIIAGLEGSVRKLEAGELSLEDSLKVFEEGIRFAREGALRLDAAETRVEAILSGQGTVPLDVTSEKR